jgi:hypothetical protein
MTLVDVSKPTYLSPRAAEQIAKEDAAFKQLEAQFEAQQKAHQAKRNGIADRDRKHGREDDLAMNKRLQSYRTRQGLREVRYLLSGKRKANVYIEAFEYIYKRCQKPQAVPEPVALRLQGAVPEPVPKVVHFPYTGTPIRIADIARHIGKSPRQTNRILDRLENGTKHGAYAVYREGKLNRPPQRQANPGVIVRIPTPGKGVRFAITVPETPAYKSETLTTFDARIPLLQNLAKTEGARPNLEPARTPGLERFQDDNYRLPDGCLERLRQSYRTNQGLATRRQVAA